MNGYGLSNQIRSSMVSIPSNFAEGIMRGKKNIYNFSKLLWVRKQNWKRY